MGIKYGCPPRILSLKVASRKFAPRFIGPYRITEVINPVSFRLELPESFHIHNVFHKSLLKKYFEPVVPSKASPPPVLVNDAVEYVASKIVDVRNVRNSLQYLIHWKGYGLEERSWVPAREVHAPRLVRKFHLEHPEKPSPEVLDPVAPRKTGGTVTGFRRCTRSPIARRTVA